MLVKMGNLNESLLLEIGKFGFDQKDTFLPLTDFDGNGQKQTGSKGIILISDDGVFYAPDLSPDIKTSFNLLNEALSEIVNICTAIASNGSPIAPDVAPKLQAIQQKINTHRFI